MYKYTPNVMINTYPYDGIKIIPIISIKKITPLQSENNSPYTDEKIISPSYPYIYNINIPIYRYQNYSPSICYK